eukprot:677365-Pelagomonas_calceolata.AAC.1
MLTSTVGRPGLVAIAHDHTKIATGQPKLAFPDERMTQRLQEATVYSFTEEESEIQSIGIWR